MARIYFASKDSKWKAKIVEELKKKGLNYDQTKKWKECEIIVADLNFKLEESGEILAMMAERGEVLLREPPPVICTNSTGAKGKDFVNLRKCVCNYLKCKPHIYENVDDIVNFIKWFDHFIPRKTVPLKPLTPAATEALINTVKTDAMKPEKV